MIAKLKRLFSGGGEKPKESPVPKVPTAQDALTAVRHEIFQHKLTFQSVPADMHALENVRQKLVLIDETLEGLGPTCAGRKVLEKKRTKLKFTEMQLEMRLGILCPEGCQMEAGA